MAVFNPTNTAYGLSQPLINVFPPPIISTRNPTTADKATIGTVWINTFTNLIYMITNITDNVADWVLITSSGGTVQFLSGNVGGPVGPDGSGNIDVIGDGTTTIVTGNPATHTLEITVGGDVATTYDADVGSAVPSGGIITFAGGTGITTTGSGNTITITAAGTVAESFPTNSGTAIPSVGVLHINGGGSGFVTSGAANVVTVSNDGTLAIAYTGNTGIATPAAKTLGITGTGGISTSASGNTVSITAGGAVAQIFPTDSGSATPSGGSLTIHGGTGITTSGAGSTVTVTLSTPVSIANGGTNATSMTTTDGTIYFDGTRLVTTTTGTSGQVLTSNGTGVAPTYQNTAASSISITGDTGGALTGNSFTFTGGTTGITFNGTGTTETLSGTLVVSNGGTGRATLTNHGVLVGAGTTAITQLAVGTTGQVLTGVTGADPVFAAPAASSITITGDSGGGLTGNSFTFTGGTTGLTFAGAGTTETLGGTLAIANGGTNATSFTQTNGITTYNGTRLVNYAGPQLSSGGIYTNTSQPAFYAYNSGGATNVTGDGTNYTVVFDTAVSNQGSNYNTGTSTFTAPVTGMYFFTVAVEYLPILVAHTTGQLQLAVAGTSASATILNYINPGVVKGGGNAYVANANAMVKMTATDTATVILTVVGSTKTVGINGGIATNPSCTFAGYLVC